jgi:Cu(I)/Ag(I) efflux system membrane protein CusA/SilA
MLNKIIKFLIENKLIALLLIVLFVGLGISTAPFDWELADFPRNPVSVDAIPDIGENQQIVFTKWDGRSPQDIEDQITYPLTTSLLGIPGVKTIRSSSAFGFSSIYIIFEEDVEFYWSRSRILEKLNSLPKGLLPNGVQPSLGPDATGLGQVFWYTLEGRDKNGKVIGGWDLHELRSIQDYYVKYALSSASGVSEVASIGGFVQEYQVDINPDLLKEYNVTLQQVVNAVRKSNKDIGAKTIEINRVEYLVRGLGYVKSVKDIEKAVVVSNNLTPILVKDVAKVMLGPAQRRGILDKEGAEVVGGVVTARYGANPMKVISNIKSQIAELSKGLPSKILKDGKISQLTIVPFYDRSILIKETLNTLNEALTLEILITVLVIVMMVFNLRVSVLISGLLPVAVLMVFIGMKFFGVDANIVALSGIAIAIGTMVDVGVILTENIIRHIDQEKENLKNKKGKFKLHKKIDKIVYKATKEVSGAILTAVATTIVSFIPVFTMIGSEGKLFRPLAATKTMALVASVIVALFLIPPFAAWIFGFKTLKKKLAFLVNILVILIGIYATFRGFYFALVLIAFACINSLSIKNVLTYKQANILNIALIAATIIWLLTIYWRPLGVDYSALSNFIFVGIVAFGLLGFFYIFQKYYVRLLIWTLANKMLFLILPIAIIIFGFSIWKNIGKEFMPSLNEGSFLLMPTSLPHAGVEENKRILQQLDIAVSTIPEVKTVVGKAGRVESALDPAPLSMYENIINYYSEYKTDDNGNRLKFKVDKNGLFITKYGKTIPSGTKIDASELIVDKNGNYFRNWRKHIKSPDDIWNEIVKVTKIPGITSTPKLQPIETRLVMLQTGMRAPMGIKVKGQDLSEIESFGKELEKILKQVKGVKKEAVFADRIVGKPYLLLEINREKIARFGLSIQDVQDVMEITIGGKILTQTVEGRERYSVRVRYPRELRSSPEDLNNILVPISQGETIPLSELVTIKYEQGPQVIKSEDTFLIGYVLFDKEQGQAEVTVVENAQKAINGAIERGELLIPKGINYKFTGTYENQIRAEKTLSVVVPLALAIIFLILYFQFRSVATTLMVFSGILVAFAGGFIMIGLYNTDWFLNINIFELNLRELFQIKNINLSVAVWVGFIALFGIATDDGVVMATYLTQVFEKNKPKSKQEIRQAVIEAGSKRIRPCLMTTATTILALLPILTSTGRGSDIMIPMAIPSFGGMLVALITLFVVPVLFSWSKEIKSKK